MIPPLLAPERRVPVTNREPSPLEATACRWVAPPTLGTGNGRAIHVCPESEDV